MINGNLALLENFDADLVEKVVWLYLLIKPKHLEAVLVGPGVDLHGVQGVEVLHLTEDVPHRGRLSELQLDVTLAWIINCTWNYIYRMD